MPSKAFVNMKSMLRDIKSTLDRFNVIKHSLPWGPYRRISKTDRDAFSQVLSVWRPTSEMPVFILRWHMTEWCNYDCPYCPQSHARFGRYGKHTAHAFDNYPLETWLKAFSQHFQERRLSLVITGGEPMIDRENMAPLLQALTNMPTVECIRIDTNVSWNPKMLKEIDSSKIILMCTYHPSQVSEESFFNHLDQLLSLGFKIGMVNFVMNQDNFHRYNAIKLQMSKRGVPLHPNPLWNSKGQYSENDLSVLKEGLPEMDYLYRTQTLSTHGEKCLFPSLAYEMDPVGHIRFGCHSYVAGSFFDHHLPPTFAGPVPCPAKFCTCLDKYSFLKGINRNTSLNPLQIYSAILMDIRKAGSDYR